MMSAISVKDIYSNEFSTVKESDTLSKCLELFKKDTPSALAVLDAKGKYAGVIARRWIVRARLDPATTKVKTLMRPAPRIDPDMSVSKVAKLMIQSGVRQIPVFQKEKIVGFVTDESIIHNAVTQDWGKDAVSSIMTKAPFTIDADRTVGAVLSMFKERDISHLPVMEGGKLVGIVSTQDIVEAIFQPNERQTLGDIKGEKVQVLTIPVKGVMSTPVVTVTPETTLKDADKKMDKQDVHCLAVVSNDRLVGIVTKLDFLEPISQMEEPDRRLTIQFAVKGMEIDESMQHFMMSEFDTFTHKYKNLLESGTLFVYMKVHGANHKGQPLVHCRLKLRTVKGVRGFYVSSSEGFGVEPTFRVALDRLDKRILRSKELSFDPTYAREFLRKYGFPSEEL
jgi:CBS domain-containing protein